MQCQGSAMLHRSSTMPPVLLLVVAAATFMAGSSVQYNPTALGDFTPSVFWQDPPGSSNYKKTKPMWYDLIQTWAGTDGKGSQFTSGEYDVNVNFGPHGAIHLFADPSFLQHYDDKLRSFNGASTARNSGGTIDRCGWPNLTASTAPPTRQYHRETEEMYEDFSSGLNSSKLYVALVKGCCDRHKYAKNKFERNINVAKDVVDGIEKNVLALTAWNKDNKDVCPGPTCHKDVSSNGALVSAGIYASGKYEVIAKVAKASGLVWALWTFHYSEHLPSNCADYTCWCSKMPSYDIAARDMCEFRGVKYNYVPCKYDDLCDNNTDGWSPTPPPPPPLMTPAQCGILHPSADPQFLGNHTFGGWETTVNHEIDIEIPANCEGTANVCNKDVPGVPGAKSCLGDYSTTNLNNYIYSQNSGTGPAYSNGCVRVSKASDGSPYELIGDGKYHNYTIVWHTGNAEKGSPGWTEFYIDGIYLGTNNAFAPTRGSRFYIAQWYPGGKNAVWNGRPDDWGGGSAGDGQEYNMTTFISSVRITPFDEPNDIMEVSTTDQPDGCEPSYQSKYPNACHTKWEKQDIPPLP